MPEPLNVLHITPHLGGGVGKAHAALSAVPSGIQRTYMLLEAPRDRRFADEIEAHGCRLIIAATADDILREIAVADIVQIEFWNHPRLMELMARHDLPAMRSVLWCHISGLSSPLLPSGLNDVSGTLAFTSACSLKADGLDGVRKNTPVISSGFALNVEQPTWRPRPRRACYLGTVDFVKMHPGVFEVVDRLADHLELEVWGEAATGGAVEATARSMRHPERVKLMGKTEQVAEAFARASIFLYPLRPGHYGTAENALIEAMSMGLAPIVMNNPAEAAIIKHGETGLVAGSIEECSRYLELLLNSPQEATRLGENAARYVREHHRPEHVAAQFRAVYDDLLKTPKRIHDFTRVIGKTPRDWFQTFWPNGQTGPASGASKGGLAHFRACFPQDAGLTALLADKADRLEK